MTASNKPPFRWKNSVVVYPQHAIHDELIAVDNGTAAYFYVSKMDVMGDDISDTNEEPDEDFLSDAQSVMAYETYERANIRLVRHDLAYCSKPWLNEDGDYVIESHLTETGEKALAACNEGLCWNIKNEAIDLEETRAFLRHWNALWLPIKPGINRLTKWQMQIIRSIKHPDLQDIVNDAMYLELTRNIE